MERIEAIFQEAVRRHQRGELTAARDGYAAVLAQDPGHAHARHYLGLIAFQQGDLATAAAEIAAAIARDPAVPEFRLNLGNVHKRGGDLAAAEAAYREALALRPDFPAAIYSLALILESRGDDAGAEPVFAQLALADPGFAEAHAALARIALRRGDAGAAEAAFARGAASPRAGVEALLAYGHFLCDRRRGPDALPVLRQAAARAPESPRVLAQLGVALDGAGRHTDAERTLRQALALTERGIESTCAAALWGNLANALRSQGRAAEALDACRQAVATPGATPDMHSNLLFQALMVEQTPAELFALHRDYARRWQGPLPPRPGRTAPGSDRPLRVGFVSPDLHRHPVGFFLRELVRHLDRQRFVLLAYHSGWRDDALTAALRADVTHWRPCRDAGDAPLAAMIAADAVDLLIDLSGHTGDNRLPLFCRRPAPVQLTFLGYPLTTGLDAIDFRVTDAVCDPPGVSEPLYSERLLRLPHSYYCFAPPDDAPAVAPLPASGRPGLSFGAFLQLGKLSPETLALWARVLTALPDARLQLQSASFGDVPTVKRVEAAFAAAGVARKRLRLLGWQPYPRHLAGYADVDLALDTLPFNLATNTCEALWMGVPTLTLAGMHAHGRMGASLMQAAGLPEFVARDANDFVARAVAWNDRRAELAALRQDLRARVRVSPLMDGAQFARDFGRLLEVAWQTVGQT